MKPPVTSPFAWPLALAMALLACKRERLTLELRKQCETPEVVTCLQEYAYAHLSRADIVRLQEEGVAKCISKDKSEMKKQSSCLPLKIGRDTSREMDVELRLLCGELPPSDCEVHPVYPVDIGTCCSKGASPFYLWGFSPVYGGCIEPELIARSPGAAEIAAGMCRRHAEQQKAAPR